MLTVAALTVLGYPQAELRDHIRGALNVGVTPTMFCHEGRAGRVLGQEASRCRMSLVDRTVILKC
jgi:hypothetical protein